MIYLDYAATSPLDPRVGEAMRPFEQRVFGNPSSLHAAGRAARAAVDAARDQVADTLGARAAEIIFTSGGTEGDNLALKGVAYARRARGNHLITTTIEHSAVLASCRALEQEGFRVTYLPPDETGRISPEQVAAAITPDTILVSVMYANNEIGTVQPIASIGEICRTQRIPFHTDAVQAAGELPLDVAALQVDLLTLSAHKFYGPKGVGALYLRSGVRLHPLQDGGGQEHERRAGTENVPGIVGLATALGLAGDADEAARIRALRDVLLEGLLAIPDSRLQGSLQHRLANNANIRFAGVPGETLVLALDLAGIAVSAGAACSAGAIEPSHVIRALGVPPAAAGEAVRFTLGRFTTEAEIVETVAVVTQTVARLRRRKDSISGAEKNTAGGADA